MVEKLTQVVLYVPEGKLIDVADAVSNIEGVVMISDKDQLIWDERERLHTSLKDYLNKSEAKAGENPKTIGELMAKANEGEQQSFEILYDMLREVQYGPEGAPLISPPPDQPES